MVDDGERDAPLLQVEGEGVERRQAFRLGRARRAIDEAEAAVGIERKVAVGRERLLAASGVGDQGKRVEVLEIVVEVGRAGEIGADIGLVEHGRLARPAAAHVERVEEQQHVGNAGQAVDQELRCERALVHRQAAERAVQRPDVRVVAGDGGGIDVAQGDRRAHHEMCRLERRMPAQELELGVDAMAVGEGRRRLEAGDVEAEQEAHEERHPRHDRTDNDGEVEDRPLERPSPTDRRGCRRCRRRLHRPRPDAHSRRPGRPGARPDHPTFPIKPIDHTRTPGIHSVP